MKAGVDAIMTAHIQVPSLDPSGDPATLSAPIVTGILRNKLHFDGVVITDALDMQGVRDKYGDDRVPVLALKAGVDVLLMPPNFPLAYDNVLAAVRSGEISEKRIDESVTRILKMKAEPRAVRGPAGGCVEGGQCDRYAGAPGGRAGDQRPGDHRRAERRRRAAAGFCPGQRPRHRLGRQ